MTVEVEAEIKRKRMQHQAMMKNPRVELMKTPTLRMYREEDVEGGEEEEKDEVVGGER